MPINLKLFYLFGFINNYSGGFSTRDGIFQRLSFTEHFERSDRKVLISKKVIQICEQLLQETGHPNDIQVETFENQNGIIIRSENLVRLINEAAKSKSLLTNRDYFLLTDGIFDPFNRQDEKSYSYQQRIQFLNGVTDSNAEDNVFYFYNDYKKSMLTHYVLSCFANEEDQIIMESHFKTPAVNSIRVLKEGL